MFAAPSGGAGFIARHHTAAFSAVAALAGFATAAAAALSWFQSIAYLHVAALGFGAVLAMAVALWHTRHLGLALLVTLTPLPGLIWAAPLSSGSEFGLVPAIAYGFGFALATLYAQYVLDRSLSTAESEAPWISAGTLMLAALAIAPVWFWHHRNADAALQAVADFAGTSVSVFLLMPLAAYLLRFDEAFIADANRARERRGRIHEWFGAAAIPRWGLSLTGIALIFVALGWFGAEEAALPGWWRYGATAVLASVVFVLVSAGWREGLALALVTILCGLTTLWWLGYDAHALLAPVYALAAALMAGLTGLASARCMRQWRASGDANETIRRRALEESNGAVFATFGAVAAVLPAIVVIGTPAVLAALGASGLCGALLFPAVLTGLETLMPRRRSVEEIFSHNRRR